MYLTRLRNTTVCHLLMERSYGCREIYSYTTAHGYFGGAARLFAAMVAIIPAIFYTLSRFADKGSLTGKTLTTQNAANPL